MGEHCAFATRPPRTGVADFCTLTAASGGGGYGNASGGYGDDGAVAHGGDRRRELV